MRISPYSCFFCPSYIQDYLIIKGSVMFLLRMPGSIPGAAIPVKPHPMSCNWTDWVWSDLGPLVTLTQILKSGIMSRSQSTIRGGPTNVHHYDQRCLFLNSWAGDPKLNTVHQTDWYQHPIYTVDPTAKQNLNWLWLFHSAYNSQ